MYMCGTEAKDAPGVLQLEQELFQKALHFLSAVNSYLS